MRTILVLLASIALPSVVLAQPNVLVTTSQLADVARNVAGEHANVTAMMGPGIDPHLYQATPRDVQNLQNADLILYHGMTLEGQLADVLESFARMRPTAAVAELAIPPDELLKADSEGLAVDPHIWMDARLFSMTAETVAEQLIAIDPDNEAAYRANAEAYRLQLLAVHGWIEEAIASIPEERRYLVTAHDAFAYYSAAYGITVAAVQGLSTESEAGVADIRETAEIIVQHGVPAVFIESTINPRTVEAVLEAVRNAGQETGVGGELYSDAMGAEDQPEGTVTGMLIHNTTVIVEALGGTVPPLPEQLDDWLRSWNQE